MDENKLIFSGHGFQDTSVGVGIQLLSSNGGLPTRNGLVEGGAGWTGCLVTAPCQSTTTSGRSLPCSPWLHPPRACANGALPSTRTLISSPPLSLVTCTESGGDCTSWFSLLTWVTSEGSICRSSLPPLTLMICRDSGWSVGSRSGCRSSPSLLTSMICKEPSWGRGSWLPSLDWDVRSGWRNWLPFQPLVSWCPRLPSGISPGSLGTWTPSAFQAAISLPCRYRISPCNDLISDTPPSRIFALDK